MWTEQAIAMNLEGHFWVITPDNKILDRGNGEPAASLPPRPWSNEDLLQLWTLKNQGLSPDEIAIHLDRDPRVIGNTWAKRASWSDQIHAQTTVRPHVPIREIRRAVCAVFEVGIREFVSASRKRRVCESRQAFYWICHRFTDASFPRMATYCGNQNHSTAVHAVGKISEQFETFRDRIELCICDLGLSLDQAQDRAAS